MRWDFLWVKIALETTESINVRVIETNRRLAWSAFGEQRAYNPMPLPYTVAIRRGIGGGSTDDQYRQHMPPHQWAAGVQTLGGEGWELVAVVPVTADVRIARLKQSQTSVGEHDVQLWLFKRARDEGTSEQAAEETGEANASMGRC